MNGRTLEFFEPQRTQDANTVMSLDEFIEKIGVNDFKWRNVKNIVGIARDKYNNEDFPTENVIYVRIEDLDKSYIGARKRITFVFANSRRTSRYNGFFNEGETDAVKAECEKCGDPACKDGEICGLKEELKFEKDAIGRTVVAEDGYGKGKRDYEPGFHDGKTWNEYEVSYLWSAGHGDSEERSDIYVANSVPNLIWQIECDIQKEEDPNAHVIELLSVYKDGVEMDVSKQNKKLAMVAENGLDEFEPEADGSEYYGKVMEKVEAIVDDEVCEEDDVDECDIAEMIELGKKIR